MALGNPLSPLPVVCTLAQEITLGTRMADRGVVPGLPRGSFSEVRWARLCGLLSTDPLWSPLLVMFFFLPLHTTALHLWVPGSLSPVVLNSVGLSEHTGVSEHYLPYLISVCWTELRLGAVSPFWCF